jgi:hypothetical protein
MTKRTDELNFRHVLQRKMADKWAMCLHEEKISPGVPDIQYAIDQQTKRIGWLELKATQKNISKNNRIFVEPSQRNWMREWREYCPIDFLILIKETVFLIDSQWAGAIPDWHTENHFVSISKCTFLLKDTSLVLPDMLKKRVQYA